MGVNVRSEFLNLACSFLNCRQGNVPFKYLGLPVAANPMRLSTWDPLLDYLKKRLHSWGKKHISLGGRIVMINSVLNSIPIFLLSLLKMPATVINKVIQIQRQFPWGGVKGGRKLCWLSWKTVCRDKKEGGLGVKDIKIVNVSLLSKWRWKLLQHEPALWKEVITAKYGASSVSKVNYNGFPGGRIASSWWKDICTLEDFVQSKKWFSKVLVRRVNNGVSTLFWSHVWCGDLPLAEAFPRLFSLSVQKEASIAELVVVRNDQIDWNFRWRRRLFSWEEDLLHCLQQSLDQTRLSSDSDLWWWKPESDGEFTVKSTYSLLFREVYSAVEYGNIEKRVFHQLWRSPAPSKLIAFSWQLTHNRIPTRDNLVSRGIIKGVDSTGCVFCSNVIETSCHLFLHCQFASAVWIAIFKWLGIIIIMPPSIPILFEYMSSFAKSKKDRNGLMLVWHTTLWLIWKARNDVIFNNLVKAAPECVEEIKVLSWKWSVHKLKISPCLYYEWIWDPGICFNH
jgi:hypothetical protein